MSIRRNTAYNLVGAAVPMVLALATVPIYLEEIGVERFGILSIAWLLLGYFGVFDLGLSRATAHQIAVRPDQSEIDHAETFWTAIATNLCLGVLGAALLWVAGVWYFSWHIDTTDTLRQEAISAMPFLALAVPVATTSGVMFGALQGRQRFKEINAISILSATLLQLFPLGLAVWLGPSLSILLSAALISRLLTMALIWKYCRSTVIGKYIPQFNRRIMRKLLNYGGWVALTSLLGPFLVIIDRFAIGALLGAVAVAIYTLPFQLAQRLSVIGSSISSALFPRLSASKYDEQELLSDRATKALASVMTLPTLMAILVMDPFLRFWIGGELSLQSAPIGKILFIGFWINAFATVPYALLQARGRPDLVAKTHIAEIPLYLGLLWFSMSYVGLVGAAMVFSLRCAVDYLLLTRVARRSWGVSAYLIRALSILSVGALISTYFPLPDPRGWAALVVLGTLALAVSWFASPPEVKGMITGMRKRVLQKGLW